MLLGVFRFCRPVAAETETEMADWQAFLWVALGVLLSAVVPYAVTALWPQQPHALTGVSGMVAAPEIFRTIWPGVRKLVASLVVGLLVLVGAKATGQEIALWWQGVLIGLAADRGVQVAEQLIRRRYVLM